MKQNLKAACGYGAAFLWLLMTEIIIGIYGLGIVRSYGGDVLVIPLLYCLVRMVTKICPRTLPLWLWGAGLFTELLQLCNLAERLGFPEGSLPAVLLGTRADWMDVLCYGVGTVPYAAETKMHCIRSRHACIGVRQRLLLGKYGDHISLRLRCRLDAAPLPFCRAGTLYPL